MPMAFEHYVQSGGKRLRCGYTTGTCAALAARGAAMLLLTGRPPELLAVVTPKGLRVEVRPVLCRMEDGGAVCAVEKDGGDDPDVTSGAWIFVRAERCPEPGIAILGGDGVGRITKPGLEQPVGEAAINRVPRQMIRDQAEQACREAGYRGGLRLTVSVPGGAELAAKTFNPQLGIKGGISILGTSGIVEPMSEQALKDTILLEIRQAAAQGARRLILTPGNYGADFLREQGLDAGDVPAVKCSNFIGDALDGAAEQGMEAVLLVGHIGKLVKLAGGIMNTHSRWADCRTELFCAYGAVCGCGQEVCAALLNAATADAGIAILDQAGLREPVLDRLLDAIQRHLDRRTAGRCRVGAVLFSNEYGLLGQTSTGKEILSAWKKEFFTASGQVPEIPSC